MRINELASKRNLELAWRRITTGGNAYYKRLYRPAYYAYEIALSKNLSDLRQRLIGGAFQPSHPERIYLPKASGLHRPISLLCIEDQIVLQAFANIAAKRTQKKRARLQLKHVFSNILQKPDSIFFFRRWQVTYLVFQRQIRTHYRNGMRWVGDFDLAAFYDSISHELLLRTIFPRTRNTDLGWIANCLSTWSSDLAVSRHGHGLPQGPIASDFLAESFMLPIDLEMESQRGYTRYVDDVRLFGATEDEVRTSLIELERLCRERGLIPQSGKFAIKKAQTVKEAMGMLPSIADPQHEAMGTSVLEAARARSLLRAAIRGRPYRVHDKTRLRFVLFRADPDRELLSLVLKLVPRHPEHADAFFYYLGKFGYRKPIERVCINLIDLSPYPYVRGEAWHILAAYRRIPRSQSTAASAALTSRATAVAKGKNRYRLVEKWGASHFLCVAEEVSEKSYSRVVGTQPPILQSLLVPVLPPGAFKPSGVAKSILRDKALEPNLVLSARLHERSLSPATYGLKEADLSAQAANTLTELGILSSPGRKVDPIGEILNRRYGSGTAQSWHRLLAREYVHALGSLKQAEATFEMGRSEWLAHHNSFNQTVFLALQRHLAAGKHPAACTTVDKHGRLVDFGVTLDAKNPFSIHCPRIADCFREMNSRRNRLPVSHAYEKKTAARTLPLTTQERNYFVAKLRTALSDLVKLMP